MSDDFTLDEVDWRRIVDEMNVSFGILRFEPATASTPSDIFLLYANETYLQHLRDSGFDSEVLKQMGYVGSGSRLDEQMHHSIEKALRDRVQVSGKMYVTSMKVWIGYYITPMERENCYYVIIINIDREQRHLAEVERLGLVDSLTNVGNRNALQTAEAELRERDGSIGVLAVDLNGLKKVNDTEGHAAGDRAIVEVARVLKETFPTWGIYRYGGDEFVVLAFGATQREFEEPAGEFVARYAGDPSARLSAGCAWGPSSQAIDEVLHDADEQMYASKRRYYQTHDRRAR